MTNMIKLFATKILNIQRSLNSNSSIISHPLDYIPTVIDIAFYLYMPAFRVILIYDTL